MTTNNNDFKQKISHKFYCKNCDYGTYKKFNYETHLLSTKHYKNNVLTTKNNENQQQFSSLTKYTCENCEKIFNDRPGLWRHKKKCNNNNNKSVETTTPELLTMISELVKSNNGLQQSILEICKNGTISNNNNNNTTNINSHNKSFNLHFFLNETCKDAMNIMDFVDSIQLQLNDLEKVGELGYVEGISNIIVKNLNSLDITQRPIHCTDKKREILYVKDENKWEKEDKENNKIRKIIKKVSRKNSSLLRNYREKYPDYKTAESSASEKYDKLVIEAMGGNGDNDIEKEDKIIKNISKVVTIEKS
jgi:hypothetical protein